MIDKKVEIFRYKNKKMTKTEDKVVVEYNLKIYVNDVILVERICLKNELDNMVLGYLMSEGYVNSIEDLQEMKFKENNELSGECFCIVDKTSSTNNYNSTVLEIEAETIIKLMDEFTNESKLFKRTGGAHSCAIVKDSEIVYFTDDVGRQNALDKMLGYLMKNEKVLGDILVLFSGRITSEVVDKLKHKNIKGIITKAAVTYNGRQKGIEKNLLVVGFARGDRFNIYNGKDRII